MLIISINYYFLKSNLDISLRESSMYKRVALNESNIFDIFSVFPK